MRSLRTRLSVAFIAVAVLTTVLSGVFLSVQAQLIFRGGPGAPGFSIFRLWSPPPPPSRLPPPPNGIRPTLRDEGAHRQLGFAIWEGTGAAALIGVLVALWLTRRIMRPVTVLTQAAEAIASGAPAPPVPGEGQDELGVLARTFNRMAAQLAADAAHMQAADTQRRRLFAGIAHELRTPLFLIQGTLEGMLDKIIEVTPARLASLHRHALLLGRLISDLRDLSLAQAGQLQLHRHQVNFIAVVREAIEAQASIAAERSVTVLNTSHSDVLPVLADADRLRQVLDNLIDNAIRYSPPGGRVWVSAEANEHQVMCAVADTGKGIAAEDLPHVFDHFYRADQSRARSTGGTGLGLAIVKSLVEAHGGSVAAASASGQGSIFTITLPVEQERSA